MFERRLIFHVDWLLLAAILVLTGIGVAMIYSTTYVQLPEPGHPGPQFRTQIYAEVRPDFPWRKTSPKLPITRT